MNNLGKILLRYDYFADEPFGAVPQGQLRVLPVEGELGTGREEGGGGGGEGKSEAGRVPDHQKGEEHPQQPIN
jgi:hypothetical protein